MRLRYILLVVGLLELCYPRQFVDFWMNLAAEDGSNTELKPWVYTAARIEGIVLVLFAVHRHRHAGYDE